MNRVSLFFLTILFVLTVSSAFGAESSSKDALRDDIEFARRKVYPALVNISVVSQSFRGGRTSRSPGAGSGVIVSPAGYVLTNFHVAGHTTRVICNLPSGEAIEASIVCDDPLTDLSVLKLKLETRSDPSIPLPFATLGDSEALRVGDYVLAMGNPFALSSSLTLGVISNTKRVFTDFTGTQIEDMDLGAGEKTGMFTRWLQHDALILPGNSGGPLVNLKGEVIGINELGGNGMGFAIPSNLAAHVLNQALTYGEVRRGWIGLSIMPVNKMGLRNGALVSSVVPSSPADMAGIQAGDYLLTRGDTPINVRFFEQVPVFYQDIAQIKPGSNVRFRIRRGDGEKYVKVIVERMEAFLGDQREVRKVGVTVRAITGPMALARRLPTQKGVILTGVRPGTPFEEARPRLIMGDIITAIGKKQTPNLNTFEKAIEGLPEKGEAVVSFLRGDERLLTVLELKPDEEDRKGGALAKPWLGLKTQVLTPPVAKALGQKGTRGFRITQVFPYTEAFKAKLKAGDIITHVEGEKLDSYRPQDAMDLRRMLEDFGVDETVEFTVVRRGRKMRLPIVLQETPSTKIDAAKTRQEEFEFSVRDVVFLDRIKYKWSETQAGVVVTEATMGGWANMSGLRTNDLIVSMRGQDIANVKDFESVVKPILEKRPSIIPIFVRRGYRTTYVFIEPDWSQIKKAK